MRVLKILGIIFAVIASMVGGAAFRMVEILNDPNPLPVPKTEPKLARNAEPKPQSPVSQLAAASEDTELAVAGL